MCMCRISLTSAPGQNFQASKTVHGSDDITTGNFWSQDKFYDQLHTPSFNFLPISAWVPNLILLTLLSTGFKFVLCIFWFLWLRPLTVCFRKKSVQRNFPPKYFPTAEILISANPKFSSFQSKVGRRPKNRNTWKLTNILTRLLEAALVTSIERN